MKKNVLVALGIFIAFMVGITLYGWWHQEAGGKLFSYAQVLGTLGLVLMMLSTIAAFLGLIHSRGLFKDNMDKGIALCIFGAVLAFLPVMLETILLDGSQSDSLKMAFNFNLHMLLFKAMTAAATGAGGGLIAADVIVKQSKRDDTPL